MRGTRTERPADDDRPQDERPQDERPQDDGPALGRLVLVRHGESVWNAERRWQGQADSPLNPAGRRQAVDAAAALAAQRPPVRFSAVWSSDLLRARETAELLAPAVGVDRVRLDPRLREAVAGPWEGLTPDEIERRWPGWLADNRRPEGFEPAERLVERALRVIDELLDEADALLDQAGAADVPPGPVMAVTHSGLLRTVRRHLGVPDLRVPNLGGVWFDRDDAGRTVAVGWFDGTLRPADRPAADPLPTNRT